MFLPCLVDEEPDSVGWLEDVGCGWTSVVVVPVELLLELELEPLVLVLVGLEGVGSLGVVTGLFDTVVSVRIVVVPDMLTTSSC